jgi:dTDP-4-dehydrorhamnose reductase
VDGTKNIVKACEETKKKLIHISTAYVFDGEKKTAYVESDKPSPIEWYGETKFLSEEAVQNSQVSWTILRIDQPFRSDPFIKMDVVHRAIAKLQAKSLPPMFVNHYFGPTFIDDLTKVFDFVIRKNITGLVHATSGESWTDYDFVQKIKEAHGFQEEILKGDLNEYLKTTNRPYQKNTVLDSRKLNSQLDFELTSIEDALSQVTF